MLKVVTDFRDKLNLSEEDCRHLMHNVMNHDRSKFSVEQFRGYVELTEYYHQRKALGNSSYEYPSEEIKRLAESAWRHHYMNENHHPERADGGIIKWSNHNAIETVCDLQAMAQEFNEGVCRKFFEEVWKPKQSKHFYDDYNWLEVTTKMDQVIKCFESGLKMTVTKVSDNSERWEDS